jgi:hypothetical protein
MTESLIWLTVCVIWAGLGGYMIGWLIAVLMDDAARKDKP